MTVDRQRIVDLFLELVRIDSLSRRERAVAQRLERELGALGAAIDYDTAGERVGGQVGNLIAHLPGTRAGVAPLLLCAHMDTVAPGENVRPVVEQGVIRSDGTTVLGGDDKSGCAVVCEAVRVLRERGIPHGPIDVVFTICEEVGLLGAKHLDIDRVRARTGLVFDSDAIHLLYTRAPGANMIEVTVEGLEAHAGMCPERGLSAIQVAAAAIAPMRLGRIDAETTANLGVIQGGTAINVVPKRVVVCGEARSHDPAKLDAQTAHMRGCFEDAAARYATILDERPCGRRSASRRTGPTSRCGCPTPRRSCAWWATPHGGSDAASSPPPWAVGAMRTCSTGGASRWRTSAPACARSTPSASGCASRTWWRRPRPWSRSSGCTRAPREGRTRIILRQKAALHR
jgi:tripeptide aminopeptidase